MPSIRIDKIPPDTDDIGQSAVVGQLLATGLEEMKQPFQKGDTVNCRGVIVFRKPDGGFISGAELQNQTVKGIYFRHGLIQNGQELIVPGWIIQLTGKPWYIQACYFEKKLR